MPEKLSYLTHRFDTTTTLTLVDMINETRAALEKDRKEPNATGTVLSTTEASLVAHSSNGTMPDNYNGCYICGSKNHLQRNCTQKRPNGGSYPPQQRQREQHRRPPRGGGSSRQGAPVPRDRANATRIDSPVTSELPDKTMKAKAVPRINREKSHRPAGWIVDSGATKHMAWDTSLFQTLKPTSRIVETANGETAATGLGDVVVYLDGSKATIREVLLV